MLIHILTFVLDIASAVVNDSLTNIVEDMGTKQVIDETPSVSSGEISGMCHVFIIGTFIKMVLKSSIYIRLSRS